MLNGGGELFVPEGELSMSGLPQLHGPAGSEMAVMQRFTELQRFFAGQQLQLAALRLNERGSWSLQLVGGTEMVLGQAPLAAKLARFVSVYRQQLKDEFARVKRIDLRYGNGLAVAWRKLDATQTVKKV